MHEPSFKGNSTFASICPKLPTIIPAASQQISNIISGVCVTINMVSHSYPFNPCSELGPIASISSPLLTIDETSGLSSDATINHNRAKNEEDEFYFRCQYIIFNRYVSLCFSWDQSNAYRPTKEKQKAMEQ